MYTLVRVFGFHVLCSCVFVVFVALHVVVLHLWVSSCVVADRCLSVVECVVFGSFVFVRDVVLGMCVLVVFVFGVLCQWSFVFHEESFVTLSVVVTASKILPE